MIKTAPDRQIKLSTGPIPAARTRDAVLGVMIDVLTRVDATNRIVAWALSHESRVVCVCNVHSVVTARTNHAHAQALTAADMVTADGAPVAWTLRRQGHFDQERVSGPDLMLACCGEAAEARIGIFLYGSTPNVLDRLQNTLRSHFPNINIVGTYAPPFRELTADEDRAVVDMINGSGARIVWVGLGCPKQEAWMHTHRNAVRAVMIGVGAAFDFHAGVVKRAPLWTQRLGLEWLHRLLQNPRRLAGRYFVGNTIFVWATLEDVLFGRARRATQG